MTVVGKPARRWAIAVLLPVPLLCGFDPLKRSNKDVEIGNTHMKAGKAEEALAAYEKAVAELPADPAAHFNRGAALFALSRFEEAGQEFLRATEAKDGSLKEAAFYNLGNAFFKKDKFKEAIEAYKRALTLDPRDTRAKWNLEIALKKQKDEEKKNEQDKGKNDKDKKDKDDQKDDQKKTDKKDDKQDEKKEDKKEEKQADKDKNDQKGQQPQPPPNEKQDKPADEREIEAVLDSLDRSPKDLEKERARMRAVRRRPPTRDW